MDRWRGGWTDRWMDRDRKSWKGQYVYHNLINFTPPEWQLVTLFVSYRVSCNFSCFRSLISSQSDLFLKKICYCCNGKSRRSVDRTDIIILKSFFVLFLMICSVYGVSVQTINSEYTPILWIFWTTFAPMLYAFIAALIANGLWL